MNRSLPIDPMTLYPLLWVEISLQFPFQYPVAFLIRFNILSFLLFIKSIV